MESKPLLSLVLILISGSVFFLSCQREDPIAPSAQPTIEILTEQNLRVIQGDTILLEMAITADAGIATLKVNQLDIPFIADLQTQTAKYQLVIEEDEKLGINNIEIELVDNKGIKASAQLAVLVTPKLTIVEFPANLSAKPNDTVLVELVYLASGPLSRVSLQIDEVTTDISVLSNKKVDEANYHLQLSFLLPAQLTIGNQYSVKIILETVEEIVEQEILVDVNGLGDFVLQNQLFFAGDTLIVSHTIQNMADTLALEFMIGTVNVSVKSIDLSDIKIEIPTELLPGEHLLTGQYFEQTVFEITFNIEDPKDFLVDDVGFILDTNRELFAYLRTSDGQQLFFKKDVTTDTLTSMLFDDGSNTFQVFFRENRPYLSVSDAGYILYSNYRPGLVDIAVISTAQEISQIYPDVQIGALPQFPVASGSDRISSVNAVDVLKFGLDIADVILCGASVGSAQYLLALSTCPSAFLTLSDWLKVDLPPDLSLIMKSTSALTGIYGCVVGSCLDLLTTNSINLAQDGLTLLERDREKINNYWSNLEVLKDQPCLDGPSYSITAIKIDDNSIKLLALGAIPPYTEWKFNNSSFQTSPIFNVSVDYNTDYTLYMKDSRGCTFSTSHRFVYNPDLTGNWVGTYSWNCSAELKGSEEINFVINDTYDPFSGETSLTGTVTYLNSSSTFTGTGLDQIFVQWPGTTNFINNDLTATVLNDVTISGTTANGDSVQLDGDGNIISQGCSSNSGPTGTILIAKQN